ncbi:hypothetical protein [Streptomyces phytophilus]|uniref:hypothetical protein n=1 Tax=Streptomyces phytophilus TaxID=722715 RepID=UPI0015F02F4E|nr:hypothetical protein [Streptomyces phytophilus]
MGQILLTVIFALMGAALMLDLGGAAQRFYDIVDAVMFGRSGMATPRLVRFLGGGIFLLFSVISVLDAVALTTGTGT